MIPKLLSYTKHDHFLASMDIGGDNAVTAVYAPILAGLGHSGECGVLGHLVHWIIRQFEEGSNPTYILQQLLA